jgi:hypothetical protein
MANQIFLTSGVDLSGLVPGEAGLFDASSGRRASMKMNNGLTQVVLAVLAMASTSEARTATDRRLALQLASRDQAILGHGTVGFALDELSWPADSQERFDSAKEFLLRSIDRARSGQDWVKLGYEPRRDRVESSLDQLADLVDQLDFGTVNTSAALPLEALVPESSTLCSQHHVYEHAAGCMICNDR